MRRDSKRAARLGALLAVIALAWLAAPAVASASTPNVTFVGLPEQGFEVAVAPDSTVLAISYYDLTRITPDGVATNQRVASPGTVLAALTVAPDGAAWIAATGAGGGAPELVKVTPDSSVTRFPLPPGGNAAHIAVSTKGDVWFAPDPFVGHLGRLRPDGSFQLTDVPYASHPGDLVAAPDGSMWFTTLDPPAINRISPTGDITPFPLEPPASGRARSAVMTLGPDGRLWAIITTNPLPAYSGHHDLVRVSLTGEIERTPLDITSTFVTDITTAPDSTVWVAHGALLTPDYGLLTPIYSPHQHQQLGWADLDQHGPQRVAATADGSLWFISTSTHDVGRYRESVGPTPVVPESPLAIALPVTAISILGMAALARRRSNGTVGRADPAA